MIQKDEKQNDEELHLVHDKRKWTKDKAPHLKKEMPNQKKPNKPFPSKTWKCKYCGQQKKHAKQTDCPTFGQQCHSCKGSSYFAKVCKTDKEKVHVAEEPEGYDSEEALLKVADITAINGSRKQLTSCITFTIDKEYKEQLVCQLHTSATCSVISHANLAQLLQNGDPPLHKSNAI